MLMLLAFTTVSAVLGKSTLRGMTALFVGLAAGCIGLDQISGQGRYTGGVPELLDGIEIVLVAEPPAAMLAEVGLAEMLKSVAAVAETTQLFC
jgi:TctA family transporter